MGEKLVGYPLISAFTVDLYQVSWEYRNTFFTQILSRKTLLSLYYQMCRSTEPDLETFPMHVFRELGGCIRNIPNLSVLQIHFPF